MNADINGAKKCLFLCPARKGKRKKEKKKKAPFIKLLLKINRQAQTQLFPLPTPY
jgi:hypothetical protein